MSVREITKEDLEKLPHRMQVEFAVFCAEQVIDKAPDEAKEFGLHAIAMTKLWLDGKASAEVCVLSGKKTWFQIDNYNAADAAAHAAYSTVSSDAVIQAKEASMTVIYQSSHARKPRVIQEQFEYYYLLLRLDELAEKALLQ